MFNGKFILKKKFYRRGFIFLLFFPGIFSKYLM